MGADLLMISLPNPVMTPERRRLLDQEIDQLTFEQLKEMDETQYCFDFDEEATELDDEELIEVRDQIKAALDTFEGLSDGSRVSYIEYREGLRFMSAGGPSWGDDPFEGFSDLNIVAACEPLYELLKAFAAADYHAELEKQTNQQTVLVQVQFPVELVGSGPLERIRLLANLREDPAAAFHGLLLRGATVTVIDYPLEPIPGAIVNPSMGVDASTDTDASTDVDA
jgi:hypothetical protein